MKVKEVKVGEVKPYWRNPRHIDAPAIEAIAKSIKEFGFNQPIVIDQENVIVVGHGRYQAALSLGMKTVPCVTLLADAEKIRAYRIADNKAGEFAKWDDEKLIAELREVSDIQSLQTFFKQDINALLAETTKQVEQAAKSADAMQESIDRRVQEMGSQFAAMATNKDDQLLDVICPHCGGEFAVPSGGE